MRQYRLHNVFPLSACFAILLMHSCKVSDNLSKTSNNSRHTITTPRIAFLNYSLAYDSLQQEYNLHLINKIITEGKIKNTINSRDPIAGDLLYSVLDNESKVLMRSYIASPLDETIEYIDNNGQLRKKDIRLDSTRFSLRIPLDPSARFISMELYKGLKADNIKLLIIDILKD